MGLLLDTHVLLWYLDGVSSLSKKTLEVMNANRQQLSVSIVSLWEISIKMSLDKLRLSKSFDETQQYVISNFNIINISPNHLTTLLTLPHHHRDPFDRLIIAQAMAEKLSVITADQHFTAYQLDIVAQ